MMKASSEHAIPGFVMISTANARTRRVAEHQRMLASVAAFRSERPEIPLRLHLLLQECDSDCLERMRLELGQFVEPVAIERQVSLSMARNILLNNIMARHGFAESDIVLFPDDDCWYPSGILARIHAAFSARAELDLWFCRYAANPLQGSSPAEHPARAAEVTRRASSNTMAMRGHLFAEGLRFDEALGVGAPNNGGEDTDVALAALRRAREVTFVDAPLIGHRDFDRRFRNRYYRGSLLAIAGNAVTLPIRGEFLRKLAVGAVMCARRDLAPRDYLDAVSAAFERYRQGRPAPCSR